MTKALSEYTYEERREMPGLTMYEKLYGNTEHDVKKALLSAMRRYGVHYLEGHYSGGHDEGGLQDLHAKDASGDEVELKTAGEHTWNHPLWAACDAVLTTKFFSWALGCSVSGTLYVDLDQKRAWTSGSIEEWVDDNDPIEWAL